MFPCCYCRRCGYDLRASSERCPECGTTFDAADPRTFRRSPRSHAIRQWTRRILILLTILILPPALGLAWLWWDWREEQQALAKLRGPAVEEIRFLREDKQPQVWRMGPGIDSKSLLLNRKLPEFLPSRLEYLAYRIDDLCLRGATDADIERVCRFRYLRSLMLMDGPVTDAGLARLVTRASIEDLWVTRTNVTDAGLLHLARLPRLRTLSLCENRVTTGGLASLRGLRGLKVLHLNDTPVTDAAVDSLAGMKGLEWLSIDDVLSSNAMARLKAALPDTTISIPMVLTPTSQPAP